MPQRPHLGNVFPGSLLLPHAAGGGKAVEWVWWKGFECWSKQTRQRLGCSGHWLPQPQPLIAHSGSSLQCDKPGHSASQRSHSLLQTVAMSSGATIVTRCCTPSLSCI
jgi:hypothetical protein